MAEFEKKSDSSRKELSPETIQAVIVAGMMLAVWLFCFGLDAGTSLDTDLVNLALSIERFDIQEHQPHPPGYLGYVIYLRLVSAISGMEPLAAVKLGAQLMIVASILLVFLTARRWEKAGCAPAGTSPTWAAILLATNPLLLYYGVDGQTHAAELASAAMLLYLLPLQFIQPSGDIDSAKIGELSPWRSVAIGLCLALGGSFRPSLVVIVGLPVLWCYWKAWKHLLIIACVAAAGTAAWLVPTVSMSGGLDSYRLASDALIGMFAKKSSLLSGERDMRMVNDNFYGMLLWGGIALMGTLLAEPLVALGGKKEGMQWGSRGVRMLFMLTAFPGLLFYTLFFIAEAGYLIGLLPISALFASQVLSRLPKAGHRRGSVALIALLQFSFFLAAPTSQSAALVFTPSLAEIQFRQDSALAYAAVIDKAVPKGAKVLAISDSAPTYLYRQLPLLRDSTDALLIYSERAAVFSETTMGLASKDGWLLIPGDALLVPGAEVAATVLTDYDFLYIGPSYSKELWETLSFQAQCQAQVGEFGILLPAKACFPNKYFDLSGHRIRWGAKERGKSLLP